VPPRVQPVRGRAQEADRGDNSIRNYRKRRFCVVQRLDHVCQGAKLVRVLGYLGGTRAGAQERRALQDLADAGRGRAESRLPVRIGHCGFPNVDH